MFPIGWIACEQMKIIKKQVFILSALRNFQRFLKSFLFNYNTQSLN